MQKAANIINYYINGEFITSNVLLQPPDTLTMDTLSSAIGIVISVHVKPTIKIKVARITVTQGKTQLLEHIINFDEPP